MTIKKDIYLYNNQLERLLFENESVVDKVKVTYKSFFKSFFNFVMTLDYTSHQYNQKNKSDFFKNNWKSFSISNKARFVVRPKTSDITVENYFLTVENQKIFIANAFFLARTNKGKLDFYIKGYNLLNKQNLVSQKYIDNYFVQQNQRINGRSIMIALQYNF